MMNDLENKNNSYRFSSDHHNDNYFHLDKQSSSTLINDDVDFGAVDNQGRRVTASVTLNNEPPYSNARTSATRINDVTNPFS